MVKDVFLVIPEVSRDYSTHICNKTPIKLNIDQYYQTMANEYECTNLRV